MKTIINKYGLWGMKNIDAKKVLGDDIVVITHNNFLQSNYDFGTGTFYCSFGIEEKAKEIILEKEKEGKIFLGETYLSFEKSGDTLILLFGKNQNEMLSPLFENAKEKLQNLYNAKIFTFSFEKNGKEIFESDFILGLSNTKEQAKAMKKQFA